jgi:hypothetical protein
MTATADEYEAATQRDPLSRICFHCDRKFSPSLDYIRAADSGRSLHQGGGPAIILTRHERMLLGRFSKYNTDGTSKLHNVPHNQMIDGCWYWGDIHLESCCSTWCQRKWYEENHD